MVQWVVMLATKIDGFNLVPGIHIVEDRTDS